MPIITKRDTGLIEPEFNYHKADTTHWPKQEPKAPQAFIGAKTVPTRQLKLCMSCRGWLVPSLMGDICPRPSCRKSQRKMQARFYVPTHVVPEPLPVEASQDALLTFPPQGPVGNRSKAHTPKPATQYLLARLTYHSEHPEAKLDAEPKYTSPSDSTGSFSRKATRGLD